MDNASTTVAGNQAQAAGNTMPNDLLELTRGIAPLRKDDLDAATAHMDSLAKPAGSLGRLEELACQLFAIAGAPTHPLAVTPGLMLTVAGDHGITCQRVSPFHQRVTRLIVKAALNGDAGVTVLCRSVGLDFWLVDAGCVGGPFAANPALRDCRLGECTADFSEGPAMSRQTCLDGLRKGIALAREAKSKGYKSLAIGEIGIGNSTTAAALYAALLDLDPEILAGPGSGALPAMVHHKIQIVRKALLLHAVSMSNRKPLDILARLGGFEIVIMTGIMLGAASLRLPFVVDGYIATAALAAAIGICPAVSGYAVLSHCSGEPGHATAIRRMREKRLAFPVREPLLDLGMRLGEGSGAALAWPIVRASADIYNNMASLAKTGVTSSDKNRHDSGLAVKE